MTVATDYLQGDWQAGVGYTDPTFGDLGSPAIVGLFLPPSVADVGPTCADRQPGDRLMRHFRPQVRGVDIWLLTSQAAPPFFDVATQPPWPLTEVDFYRRGNTDFGLPTYWRHFRGGTNNVVNAIEAASLAAAGYDVFGAWATWDQVGLTWDQVGLIWE